MYLDNTAPTSTISITGTAQNYNNNIVKITVGGSDDDSKIKEYCYTTTDNSAYCAWNTSNVFNNVNTQQTEGSGNTVTYYAFTKDKAGNISSSKKGTYTLYTKCTAKTRTGNGSYGSCSAECDGGTKYRDVYYEDSYLGVSCPNGSESTSCNSRSCCSSTTSSYQYCSADCGWGSEVYREYSTYTGEYCGTSYGSDCYAGSCYTPPPPSYDPPAPSCDAACEIKEISNFWQENDLGSQANFDKYLAENGPIVTSGGTVVSSYQDVKDIRSSGGLTTNDRGDCTINVTC